MDTGPAPAEPAAAATSPAPAAPPAAPVLSPKKERAPVHFEDADGLFKTVCRASMSKKKCTKKDCQYVHDKQLCTFFWRTGECKFGAECRRNHFVTVGVKGDAATDVAAAEDTKEPENGEKKAKQPKAKPEKKPKVAKETDSGKADESAEKKPKVPTNEDGKKTKKPAKDASDAKKPKAVRAVKGKNTECFEPRTAPADVRITYDLGSASASFSTSLTTRDVLLAPNVFSDFTRGELYAKLLAELTACGIPEERLLKMWHGNDKIDGTHLIADDKTRWKANCPTFQLVVDRLAAFFAMNVQATRFNWYKDTSQWKPFHFDAAAVKPEMAAKQNFTVGVSFGATRDAAFEHATTKTVVSIPQPDGCVYAFARDTNILWRHGILQDAPVRQEGRISVIAWGWIDGMVDPLEAAAAAK